MKNGKVKMKNGDSERGSTTVENVIWLPLLLLIFAAIIQFGLIFNARNAVEAASFEAARQAAVSETPILQAEEAVYEFAQGVLPGWSREGRVRAQVVAPEGTQPGTVIRVDVSYDVPVFFANLIPNLETSPGVVTVKGSSAMAVEEKP